MPVTARNRYLRRILTIGSLGCLLACSSPVEETASSSEPAAQEADQPARHGSHTPRHDGQFFMSEDLEHHLEGALLPSGELRVYLYDARTLPLPAGSLRGTVATMDLPRKVDTPIG